MMGQNALNARTCVGKYGTIITDRYKLLAMEQTEQLKILEPAECRRQSRAAAEVAASVVEPSPFAYEKMETKQNLFYTLTAC